ncbi:thiamine-phosphate kinase [Candidatus Nitrosopumilus salaria BD31]|uniref:Thiamine-monophosphate kinase n=1 Tax=Candidatus Nitrosopumilus salarius BD31 TaxID=859350 RepID=I3D462_9ARCH|nr:thiamine-phosphate kinase [Candidatus Nitrosopumilus salaria]EIJ66505.1 thiamine-phosphate kinase [Candidatus Nitrosopumilus salaria BD31]
MTKLDEISIIRIFQNELRSKKFVSEDVEIFNFGKTKIAAKTDTLVESTDIPPKMKLFDAARKSIVACVSDFAAKGIKPQYGIVSVNLPKSISRSKINEIALGFRKACDEYDISILGGDTNEGKEIVFNVCIFGETDKIVKRKGSKKNDLIFATGPFGYTSAGLNILLNKKKVDGRFAKKVIKSVINPKPQLKFGLKNKKYFSSSMDSSDGLSTTLNEMSNQSKKKFVINNRPCMRDLEDYAKSQKLNLNDLIFHGGEEYEFVFTTLPKHRKIIQKNAKILKIPIIEIGYVTLGKGVYVKDGNSFFSLKDLGWKHFR